ncbi:MAG: hypothetical protein KJ645_12085 [Planctomycetes bacterium]|nr:hypothetical protein [Planctomycetota bacterium]
MDTRSFHEVLKTLIGQVITVINPSSYIRTLTGFRIDAETYQAKVISSENGTLRILIETISNPQKNSKEKAYQYIPIEQIKHVQVSKSERHLML